MRYIEPLILCCCCVVALAQGNRLSAQGHPDAQEPTPTFQSKVDLVLVPVVVRDAHGRPIAHLTKDNFQLFDKGKLRAIASFLAVERANVGHEVDPNTPALPDGAPGLISVPGSNASAQATSSGSGNKVNKHLIYLFDDLNVRFADLATLRAAAERHFKNTLAPGDQAAIYTFSGKPALEFTADPQKLENAVSLLRWRAAAGRGEMQCPDVSYYLADLILVKGDGQALEALIDHTVKCAHARPEIARQIAVAGVNREMIIGQQDTQVALRALRRAIRVLSGMSGERVIVLASPGFFVQTPEAIRSMTEILDLAAKSNVIVSGLSARGVILAEEEQGVAESSGFARRHPLSASSASQLWLHYRRESARANGDVMKDLAEGTGGTFFHDNNDLRAGLDQLAAGPRFSYVLGFSPNALQADGSFHSIKVHLSGLNHVSVEARRGYYALNNESKDTTATAQMADAVFARDQVSDIPVVLQTGYSKPNNSDRAKILVVAKFDMTSFQSRKRNKRTFDFLSIVAALFDSDGGYISGTTENVNLRLRDENTPQSDYGLTVRLDFDVKAGSYLMRLVARDAESKAMTTLNRTVTVF